MKSYNKRFAAIIYLLTACQVCIIAQPKVELINQTKESLVLIHSYSLPFRYNMNSFSSGTGYVADSSGLIITNSHVIKNSNSLLVYSTQKNEPFYASIVWQDTTLDLAVIKAYDCQVKSLELADPKSIQQGEEILLFGFSRSGPRIEKPEVTWGLLSSETTDSTLLTTAAINRGNSGGPAVNAEGRVIGTVFAKNEGIGIEGTGYISNIRYTRNAIINAKTELNKPINYGGTTNLAAYKKISEACVLGWQTNYSQNKETNDTNFVKSKACILEAIDLDPNYGEAYYFLAAYYFNRYLKYCLRGGEYDATDLKNNFIKAYENAERIKPSLGYDDNYLARFKKELTNNNTDCSLWRETIKKEQELEANKKARLEELILYVNSGNTPQLLKKTVNSSSSVDQTKDLSGSSESDKSTFLRVAEFEKYKPVRFSVVFPQNVNGYNDNIGFSLGNAGNPNSDHYVFFKNQISFELLQNIFAEGYSNSLMILSYNLGIQAKFFQKARFNPKPYLTIGVNPALSKVNIIPPEVSKWYYNNGAINMGADLDIWLTSYFGLSLSYEYTYSISNFLESLYNQDNSLYLKYSKFKIGLIF
jgi:hypothetical protein